MERSGRQRVVDRGRWLVAQGHPALACRLLEFWCARHPDDDVLRGWLGVFLVENRQYERAAAILERVLERRPGFMPAAHALLKIPLRQGQFAIAECVYEELAATRPRFASAIRATVQPGAVGQAFKSAVRVGAQEHDCVVFYHLPFTGGTSWQRALRYVYDGRQLFDVRRRTGLRQLYRYSRLPRSRLERLRCIHLHHPYPLDPHGRRLIYFTVLRSPVERFLSGYFKRLQKERILATGDWTREAPGPEEYLEWFASAGLADGQARQLAALHPDLAGAFSRVPMLSRMRRVTAEEELAYVEATAGLAEHELIRLATEVLDTMFLPPVVLDHMEAGYLSVFARLGVPVIPRLAHIGASNRTSNDSVEALRGRITRLHPVDTALHARAKAQFEADFAPLMSAVASERGDVAGRDP